MILAVHVDDCMLAAKSLEVIATFKQELAEYVEVTDLGELHWLLGMEINATVKPARCTSHRSHTLRGSCSDTAWMTTSC